MAYLRCCVVSIPVFAVLAPLVLSLFLNGWINEYVPPKGWSVDQIPDMSGKVAIITGPTLNGIGYESGVELAAKGAHVIFAGRSKTKGEAALAELKGRVVGAKADFMILDLGNLQSVKTFAESFRQTGLPLHVLLNSAGVMANPFSLTADGIESQFATNHVGHFLLTKLLLPILEESAPSRIVSVSSAAAFIPDGFPPFLDPMEPNFTDIYRESEQRYTPFSAYGRSKIANVLFASGLNRRLAGKKVYANSCHPGGIKTNLGRHIHVEMKHSLGETLNDMYDELMGRFVLMSPSQGAVTQLYLAAAPQIEADAIRGRFFYPQAREMEPPKSATEAKENELWEVSERLVADFV